MRRQTAASFCLLIFTLSVLHPISLHADALADFSGGIDDSSPNQFRGSSGQGWSDGWKTVFSRRSEGSFSFEIEKDSSFEGGADVLRVARNEDEGFVTLSRPLDPSETALDAPQEVSFQIRLDEFTGSQEKPFFFTLAGYGQGNETGQSLGNTVWCLLVVETDQTPTWAIYHGDASGKLTLLNTKIPLEVGTVYSIKVDLLPAEHSFRVTLKSDSQFYESPSLSSMNTQGGADMLSFAGWTANNGPGKFRWSLGPVSVRNRASK